LPLFGETGNLLPGIDGKLFLSDNQRQPCGKTRKCCGIVNPVLNKDLSFAETPFYGPGFVVRGRGYFVDQLADVWRQLGQVLDRQGFPWSLVFPFSP